MIYLDNAATTFPKPRAVLKAMAEKYADLGVSPGRGSYDLAAEAERLVNKTREKLARFFGAPDPDGVIFAHNATDALNTAIQGLVRPGDHIIATRLEHNSVLRPLFHLQQSGRIEYDLVPFDRRGFVDPQEFTKKIKPNTRLAICCHASNVLGTIQPVEEIGRVCAEREVPLLIDAAQSAGIVPIDMTAMQISAIAFTGHKSLFGPTGTGGLVIHPDLDIHATRFGGTGVDSRELVHTPALPHRLEAGTLNLAGIIGLSAGLDFIEEKGMEAIHRAEMGLLTQLRDGLAALDSIELFCAEDLTDHTALLTVKINHINPTDTGAILDADFGIAVRVGLHCAPLVHQDMGTLSKGAVRFSLGPFNTAEEIHRAVEAVAAISVVR